MVYHEELRLAGLIDMIYENTDGSLLIYDWKRSKGIEKTPRFNKYAKLNVFSIYLMLIIGITVCNLMFIKLSCKKSMIKVTGMFGLFASTIENDLFREYLLI